MSYSCKYSQRLHHVVSANNQIFSELYLVKYYIIFSNPKFDKCHIVVNIHKGYTTWCLPITRYSPLCLARPLSCLLEAKNGLSYSRIIHFFLKHNTWYKLEIYALRFFSRLLARSLACLWPKICHIVRSYISF